MAWVQKPSMPSSRLCKVSPVRRFRLLSRPGPFVLADRLASSLICDVARMGPHPNPEAIRPLLDLAHRQKPAVLAKALECLSEERARVLVAPLADARLSQGDPAYPALQALEEARGIVAVAWTRKVSAPSAIQRYVVRPLTALWKGAGITLDTVSDALMGATVASVFCGALASIVSLVIYSAARYTGRPVVVPVLLGISFGTVFAIGSPLIALAAIACGKKAFDESRAALPASRPPPIHELPAEILGRLPPDLRRHVRLIAGHAGESG